MSKTSANEQAGAVVHASQDDFASIVLQSPLPVLVKFGADSRCPPCRMIGPFLEVFARAFTGRALVVEVDKDASPELAARYNIGPIPRLLVFKNDEFAPAEPNDKKYDGLGFASYTTLRRWANERLFGEAEDLTLAEAAFAAASEAAMAEMEKRSEELNDLPERKALVAAMEPFGKRFQQESQEIDAAVTAQKIDAAERERLLKEARQRLHAGWNSETVAPLLEAYYDLEQKLVEQPCIAALFAAVEQFFPLKEGEGTADDVITVRPALQEIEPITFNAPETRESGEETCELGDKSCQ